MFKNYLKGIEGIASYPVFSLLVFFVFFISLTIWLVRADKKRMQVLSELPLEDSNKEYSSSKQTGL